MPELKKKLKEMEENGIIEVVDEPTEWVHNLAIAQKPDGSLQLCLDPKALNKNIKREIFEIPTFEQIVPQLGGKKVFTTLDQKDAYWQVELDKASSRLCTSTHLLDAIALKECLLGFQVPQKYYKREPMRHLET
ncbi:retrovirus-related pol polyprotein from transposon 297-like protein [Plakobranchus ocellatus]|uniref:Retrovirus-related pol polyprotein from transposon 297-like protein n=1 Tax=Plakobranchus ocellatus TaxID=259542 RepID=A0AAV4CN39_9GAST|nr:retrovirus-related pol polyprotein from transposon 297-like protein [Plakobranchus ocellatus]